MTIPGHDESVYAHVMQQLARMQAAALTDHRHNSRESFPSIQQIAAWPGDAWPSDADFEHVRCFDLSTTGFSFLRHAGLPEKKLVVALGTPPDVVQLTAEVMHETPLILVGCRFTSRVCP